MHTKNSETPMEESGINQVAAATAEKSSEFNKIIRNQQNYY